MLHTALRLSGVAHGLGRMKLRLEEKAEDAAAQVKGVAVRIAVAAGLVLAAILFLLLALIAGLVALYAYLAPVYGVAEAFAIVGGLLLAVAAICALIAMYIGRRRSARKMERRAERSELALHDDDEWAYNGGRTRKRRYRSEEARAAAEVTDSIVSLASATGRSTRRLRGNGHDTTADAVSLLQTSDRRTMMAVLGAVAAVGWLLGRTMPHSMGRAPTGEP